MSRERLAPVLALAAAVSFSAGAAAPRQLKGSQPKLTPPKVGVKVGAIPPLGSVDLGAVKAELLGEVRGQVSICAAVHALRGVPCASQVLLQKLIPQLLPIEVSQVGIRKQDSAEIERLVKNGQTEAPPPELQNLPYDLTVSLKIPALQVTPGPSFETLAAAGKLDLVVTAPKIVKTVRSTISFSGLVRVDYAPAPGECKAASGGDSIRLYPHLSVVSFTIDTLATDRVWWAKLLPGDRLVKWLVNHLLSWAASAIERKDERATVANAGLGLDKNPRYPLGFPVCLGKGPCGPPAKASLGWATAKVTLGKLGAVQYAKAGINKPFLALSSSQFLCEAFEAAKSVQQCARPLFDAVLKTALPLTLALPTAIERAVVPNAPPPLDLLIKGLSLQAADAASNRTQVSASFAAAIADPKNRANAPFEVTGTGQVLLGAVCDKTSFYLWNALSLDSLAMSSAVPAWLTQGIGKAAVNAHLPAIDVCLGPAEVQAFGGKKWVDVCGLGERLVAAKSTGVAADAALEAILPLRVQPAKLLPPGAPPRLVQGLQGITVEVTQAKLATGQRDAVTAAVSVTKAGETDALQGSATVAFALTAQCHAQHGQLRLVPDVTELAVTHLPAWLVQTTLLQLANEQLAKAPPLLCIQGECKTRPRLPVARAALPAPAVQTSGGCETVVAR